MIVVDCTAAWCGPCKMITPHYENMSKVYSGVKFYKLDIDSVPEVARKLNVRAVPTFVFFKGGRKVSEVQGANIRGVQKALEDIST